MKLNITYFRPIKQCFCVILTFDTNIFKCLKQSDCIFITGEFKVKTLLTCPLFQGLSRSQTFNSLLDSNILITFILPRFETVRE